MASLFGNAASKPGNLFGAQPATASTSGGLFGSALGSSTPATTGGLFGGPSQTPASQAPASGGLFGSSTTAQPAQTGNLFGTNNTQAQAQASTGGLFGAKPASSTGGLFGGALTATSQAPAGGLFGNSTTTAAPASGGMFGTSNTAPSGGLFGASTTNSGGLFGATQTNMQASQPQQQVQNGQIGNVSVTGANQNGNAASGVQAQNGQAQSAYFNSLLEKSRKRAHGETALDQLPELQLGLGDLRQRARNLGISNKDVVPDGRAQYLLAGSGVDLGSAVRDLSYLDAHARRDRQQSNTTESDDVESYLAKLQTQTTMDMIADSLARSVKSFDVFLEENVTMEWDAQRKRIYQHFGLTPKEAPTESRNGRALAESTVDSGAFGRSRRSKAQFGKSSRAGNNQQGSIFGRSSMHKSVIGASRSVGSRAQIPFTDVEKNADSAGRNLSGQDDRSRREKEAKFAEKVQGLNAARLARQAYPLLHELLDVETQMPDEHAKHVILAYKATINMVGETTEKQAFSDTGALQELQYADAYLGFHSFSDGRGNDTAAQRTTRELQDKVIKKKSEDDKRELNRRILAGSCRHLEQQFFIELESLIEKNPREANLGGVPDVLSKVRAYVRLKALRKDLVPDDTDLQTMANDEQDYVWAVVFVLLRSGHVEEACKYVQANASLFNHLDRSFRSYIEAFQASPERQLKSPLLDQIKNEYNTRMRLAPTGSIDPFRMACYSVIGRCDLQHRALNGIYHSMEDWLWLQFTLARESSKAEVLARDTYGLDEVQQILADVVAKHAPGNAGFGVFFYIQVLCGRFEQAISFLYAHQYIDAVHFAIALNYYGLLRISGPDAPESELLTFSTRQEAQISFARMIGYYTQEFRAANVIAAVDYLSLICLNQKQGANGPIQVETCHRAMQELVLETREFAQLLGDIQVSGERVTGAIEERLQILSIDTTNTTASKEFMKSITLEAAAIAEENGRITDAVLLYHLGEEYDHVMNLASKALSDALMIDANDAKMILEPAKSRPENRDPNAPRKPTDPALSLTSVTDPETLAHHVMEMYYSNLAIRNALESKTWETIGMLRQIYDARNLIQQKKYEAVLETLGALQILPIHAKGSSTIIRSCATNFANLSPALARLVPNMITWTIEAAQSVRAKLLESPYSGLSGTRQDIIEQMQGVARDLMMYGGFLRYRLPEGVVDLLARIAAE